MADAVPNAKIISNAGTFLLGFLRLTADKYLPLHGSQRPPCAMAAGTAECTLRSQKQNQLDINCRRSKYITCAESKNTFVGCQMLQTRNQH